MKRIISAIVASIVLALPVHALDLNVRSGEHADFSRLVFDLPVDAEWSLDQTGRDAVLNVDLPDVRFQTGQVFERMPRTRLVDLSQTQPGGPLQMTLGCDCIVEGFLIEGPRLVIDIAQAPPPGPDAFPLPENARPYRFARPAAPGSAAVDEWARRFLRDAAQSRQGAKPKLSASAHGQGAAPVEAELTPLLPRVVADRAAGLETSRERLLDQIDRAVGQGLLEPLPDAKPGQVAARDETKKLGASDTQSMLKVSKPGLAVITAVDQHMSEAIRSMTTTSGQEACLPSEAVSLGDWGTAEPFGAQIADKRSQLYTEFDRLDPAAQIALARTYLYFGFGAEALRVLELSNEDSSDRSVMFAMARLFEDQPSDVANPFHGQQICEGDSALWAMLSASDVPVNTNDQAVLRSLSRMPAHLRVLIAPRVGRKYAVAGRVELANAALRLAERAATVSDPAFDMARASANDAAGRTEAAARLLTTIIESASGESAQALIDLIEIRWKTRAAVAEGVPELAAAYALEYRNAALGPALRRAHMLALALDGQFDAAAERLADLGERDGAIARAAAYVPLVTVATERADDLTFLELALNDPDASAPKLPSELASQLAQRMLSLGFSDEALSLLDGYERMQESQSVSALRAQAALAVGMPARSLLFLEDVSGEEADQLRANAMMQTAAYTDASALFTKLGDDDSAARSAWLAGEFVTASTDTVPIYSEAMNEAAFLTTEQALPQTPLAAARTLIDGASDARARVSRLLALFPVTSDND